MAVKDAVVRACVARNVLCSTNVLQISAVLSTKTLCQALPFVTLRACLVFTRVDQLLGGLNPHLSYSAILEYVVYIQNL